jgi:hypothetical protein
MPHDRRSAGAKFEMLVPEHCSRYRGEETFVATFSRIIPMPQKTMQYQVQAGDEVSIEVGIGDGHEGRTSVRAAGVPVPGTNGRYALGTGALLAGERVFVFTTLNLTNPATRTSSVQYSVRIGATTDEFTLKEPAGTHGKGATVDYRVTLEFVTGGVS